MIDPFSKGGVCWQRNTPPAYNVIFYSKHTNFSSYLISYLNNHRVHSQKLLLNGNKPMSKIRKLNNTNKYFINIIL